MPKRPTFVLGITMAGAVSAGAYNAGVFDFLIQALEEWEKAKAADAQQSPQNRAVPSHDVQIPVISGASAGGITAALGLVAVAAGPRMPNGDSGQDVRCVLPLLHQAWVERISFVPRQGQKRYLLDAHDLAKPGGVTSLLDASVIEDVANELVETAQPSGSPRPYLASNLHLFLTLTNLRGVPYKIAFTGEGADAHMMSVHGDRVHYTWKGLGGTEFKSKWLEGYGDHGVEIDLQTLQHDRDFRRRFLAAAIGTGAFPIGLPARLIETHTDHYKGRAWPHAKPDDLGEIEPAFPEHPDEKHSYQVDFAASDGGIVDNEPFELARWTIMRKPGEQNNPSADKAERAVLMVDPFPEPPAFDPELRGEKAQEQVWLRSVLAALFPALKNQARVKAIDLARTVHGEVFSRFLVAPSRQIPGEDTDKDAADPLASGVLEAFGGFLRREFPEHDYQLGRRNCQRFLERHFRLAAENAIFKNWPEKAKRVDRFHPQPGFRVVIPLFGSAAEPVPPPKWPRIDEKTIALFMSHVRRRGDALINKIARDELGGRFTRFILRSVWKVKRKDILVFVRGKLEADLIRRDQHERWAEGLDELDRRILAALVEPIFDYRTAGEIAREINRAAVYSTKVARTSPQEVRRRLVAPPLRPHVGSIMQAKKELFFLRARIARWKHVAGVRQLRNWWRKPAIDDH